MQAKLVDPPVQNFLTVLGSLGFKSPRQPQPYGFDLKLTYQVEAIHQHPDNYLDDVGFQIFSASLIQLITEFGVKSEAFPVTVVDRERNVIPNLDYLVFHLLEDVVDAMDHAASEWTGDHDIGISRLVLDAKKVDRPMFICDHLYVPLMRDDLKQEIERRRITGFAFLAPEHFRSGSYGFPSARDYITID